MVDVLILSGGAAGLVLASAALYGWGRLARRLAVLPDGAWPLSIALGLALCIFLGGLLNLGRLAYPWALDGLAFIGLGLTLYEWRRTGLRQVLAIAWPLVRAERRYAVLWYAIMVPLIAFTVATELSPQLYNLADDFQKYFAHAVRMVQTGTLAGSPLNALGSETLGAQAFIQGFIVGHLPIGLINGADRVFCFVLCLMLAGGVAIGRPALGPAAILGVLTVFFIHPQYVNVSSLYSTAALLMALTLLAADPRESTPATVSLWRRAIAPALLMAGIIALKPTGLLFLALQFLLLVPAAALASRDWRTSMTTGLAILVWSAIFTVPWLLLYVPDYTAGFTNPMPPPSTPIPLIEEPVYLFSSNRAFYGGSYLAYTIVALALSLYAVLCASSSAKQKPVPARLGAVNLAASCGAAAATYFLINTLGMGFVESLGTLRYSIPVLIGIAPVAIGLVALHRDDAVQRQGGRRGTWLAAIVGMTIIGMFTRAAVERVELLFEYGSELAFLRAGEVRSVTGLLAYESAALHGQLSEEITYFQEKIPAGEAVIAWIGTPFLLDFRRNPIIDVNDSGLGTAWSRAPSAPFVLWQFQGYGITAPQDYVSNIRIFGRRMAFVLARALDFRRSLEKLLAQSDIITNEDGVVVMRPHDQPGH